MSKELQKKAIEEAQKEWGKGSVQLRQYANMEKELHEMADAPFARTADDPKLEKERKELVREGDPMAEYFQAKKSKYENEEESSRKNFSKSAQTTKPRYCGPKPPPNRFGITPGYRWDAVDRGNNVEKRILFKISERSAFDEDKYKWSVADM